MPLSRLLLAGLLASVAVPAAAQQQSEGYKFLTAVKDAKGNDVTTMLEKPGSSIINARDIGNGEGALHIVVNRGDETYLRYLLAKGADPNLRDGKGNTPMLLAVNKGLTSFIPILAGVGGNPNLGNTGGETPLIRAAQNRDVAMVRALLAAGADPDQTDTLAGMSARDYVNRDGRNAMLTKIFADTPKSTRRKAVAGPKF